MISRIFETLRNSMLEVIFLITEYEQNLQNVLTINRNHCYCYDSRDIKKKTILMRNT